MDTQGSFSCACVWPGTELGADGRSCPYKSASSDCAKGYKKDSSSGECVNVNECIQDPEPCEQLCMDTPGSFTCACPWPGTVLAMDGRSCESAAAREVEAKQMTALTASCEDNNGGCEQMCTMEGGKPSCSCSAGFKLQGQTKCMNVNECARSPEPCEQLCVDTQGSFSCSCVWPGTELAADGRSSCAVVMAAEEPKQTQKCSENNGGCDDICTMEGGEAKCSCQPGYKLKNGNKCVNVNECAAEVEPCEQLCMDTEGSFSCACVFPGTELAADGHLCVAKKSSECSKGYMKNGNGECVNVNECAQDPEPCDQLCMDTPGSFTCACPFPGTVLAEDGKSCKESATIMAAQVSIQEKKKTCSQNNGECEQVCTMEGGEAKCSCLPGYSLQNGKCMNVNECLMEPCEQLCIDTQGSFTCSCVWPGTFLAEDQRTCAEAPAVTVAGASCKPGQKKNADGACVNINECAADTTPCEQLCIDTEGSFACECVWPATVLAEDGRTCNSVASVAPKQAATIEATQLRGAKTCETDNGGCEQLCIEEGGQVTCGCSDGYTLKGKTECVNVNECAAEVEPCEQLCIDTQGSFICSCVWPGTELAADGRSCVDKTTSSLECAKGFKKNEKGQCVNVNECAYDPEPCEQLCMDTPGSFTCACPWPGTVLAMDGRSCESAAAREVEAKQMTALTASCEDNNGGCEQMCTMEGGKPSCSCSAGFKLQGQTKCMNVNECARSPEPCEQLCVDTQGSFSCSCVWPGTELAADGRSCVEKSAASECASGYKKNPAGECVNVNECAVDDGPCEQLCMDTPGSFTCACPFPGTVLAEDGKSCKESATIMAAQVSIQEKKKTCSQNNGGCEQACTMEGGEAKCSCLPGYSLQNGKCMNVNECAGDDVPCDQLCIDTQGSFTCSCVWPGTQLAPNGRDCVDKPSSASCPKGYEKDASSGECVDVNECMQTPEPCEQLCMNTPGSYSCQCVWPGTVLADDGKTCRDASKMVSEVLSASCNKNNGGCQQMCSEEGGEVQCGCKDGYILKEGGRCVNANECAASPEPCEQLCIDTEGSFACACVWPGTQLQSDGKSCEVQTSANDKCPKGYAKKETDGECENVNECAADGMCEQLCIDTPGSFTCSCIWPGTVLAEDGKSCNEVGRR
uniref:EGF-like domain-containing protein n=1 Tax=Chromera velia CCMP2878 TaxID=1169474 RepID=A0A0G4FEM4_9ALVE|eukprot:Cvel_16546.t1-p1 / transcript=Cvel_16546.t1 / gene=Cvel_16546 / organism=Chromera_velia_CCMP2878 / gene_product=Fibrillin-1, putative / transcript_product=Fibrillin-1, putative / location=Cvel_scaffold1279:15865-23931(-) / protein_length=1143 / sequence_SO=supercontig / SO=protein_coding / is_pseudo=false